MQNRIGVVLLIIGGFLHTLPVQASLRNTYFKLGGFVGSQRNGESVMRSPKDNFGGSGALGYRLNAYEYFEVEGFISPKGGLTDTASLLRNTTSLVYKKVIPHFYPLKVYFLGGMTWKPENNAKSVVGGAGVMFHNTRRFFGDLSFRYYRIPDMQWFDNRLPKFSDRGVKVKGVFLSAGYHLN